MQQDRQIHEPFWAPWYNGKSFTTDWASRAFQNWAKLLAYLHYRPIEILEIGAWEGRSTLFFLNFFGSSHVTCLDLFTFGNEGLFDANVMQSEFSSRVTKIKGRSAVALDRLLTQSDKRFDLIYIDGSHERDDVMIDSILAWRIAKEGAIVIWDDYAIFTVMAGHFDHEDQNPQPAIDTFLSWHASEADIIHKDYQMIVKKTKAHYPTVKDDPERS